MITGFIICDLIFKEGIEWVSALLSGFLAGFTLWVYTKHSAGKK